MQEITCSFCGIKKPKGEAKSHFVAGARAFICRGCVELCIDVFSSSAEWRDQQIAKLTDLRSKPQK